MKIGVFSSKNTSAIRQVTWKFSYTVLLLLMKNGFTKVKVNGKKHGWVQVKQEHKNQRRIFMEDWPYHVYDGTKIVWCIMSLKLPATTFGSESTPKAKQADFQTWWHYTRRHKITSENFRTTIKFYFILLTWLSK